MLDLHGLICVGVFFSYNISVTIALPLLYFPQVNFFKDIYLSLSISPPCLLLPVQGPSA